MKIWAIKKHRKKKMSVAEMHMVTQRDKVRNENIFSKVRVASTKEKIHKNRK